jgi:anti-sigma regulatory factor (Ser/Thr protein kinase)
MMAFESDHDETTTEGHLHLSVPAHPQAGVHVRRDVLAFAERHGVVDDAVIDFVTAVGEALANAIEHAAATEPIEIRVWMRGNDRLFASVQDNGVGFSPIESPVDGALPDMFAERGRGLPIMQRCADVFRIRSAPGEGTLVTLGCDVNRRARRSSVRGRSLAG